MKLKPFPKMLLILAVVGAAGAGINYAYDAYQAKKALEPQPQPQVQAPVEQPAQAQVQPQPEAAPQPQAPSGDRANDRGMDALLKNAGQK